MHRILILGNNPSELQQFEKFLPDYRYQITYVTDYIPAIGVIESNEVDLFICGAHREGVNPVNVYKVIESFLKDNGVPVFLVLDNMQEDLIKSALVLGVDNLLFRPFNYATIEKKIVNQFRKVKAFGVQNHESFMGFFNNNTVPMFILESGKVKMCNDAFKLNFTDGNESFYGKSFLETLDFPSDSKALHQYNRLLSGLIQFANIEEVSTGLSADAVFDIYMVKDVTGSIIVQLNQKEIIFNTSLVSKVGEGNSDLSTINLADNYEEESVSLSKLTQREKEIYKLSASGYPIKVIAQELNLSPRTVEKHRANIMGKVGAKSMIEAINLI
ncbi:LuxR C-terminal-related transcriptional regulator [Belliella sp. DSM 111904]|uniref:LuxR C-terminal-related transcriptional regulator n=1 Tax=Belliella filtrata TaxID=2923435 RepID=A0ABS9V1Z0_9BACT|nr:LuxR C-terminal-related transcriptional regulator [Belliella filtrata]MCH7410368.1 LuxR C-terminal-related transcriptional regulator [Belliella filtrata]